MLTLLTADMSGLGRVNRAMLSETQVMELFFVPDDYDDSREKLKGDASDACTWKGLECNTNKQVMRIDWFDYDLDLAGEINFTMLPQYLCSLVLIDQKLRGEVDLCALPMTMLCIQIEFCHVTGTLDLGGLPNGLQGLYFTDNRISGIRNVRNLPVTLRRLQVNETAAQPKSVHIGKLPSSEIRINLYNCGLKEITFEDVADKEQVGGVVIDRDELSQI